MKSSSEIMTLRGYKEGLNCLENYLKLLGKEYNKYLIKLMPSYCSFKLKHLFLCSRITTILLLPFPSIQSKLDNADLC